jgi:hypothetical protein
LLKDPRYHPSGRLEPPFIAEGQPRRGQLSGKKAWSADCSGRIRCVEWPAQERNSLSALASLDRRVRQDSGRPRLATSHGRGCCGGHRLVGLRSRSWHNSFVVLDCTLRVDSRERIHGLVADGTALALGISDRRVIMRRIHEVRRSFRRTQMMRDGLLLLELTITH